MDTNRLIYATKYVALQDAINATGRRSRTVFLPNGVYVCPASLDLTACSDLTFIGESQHGVVILSSALGQPALDLCGSSFVRFRNLTIRGDVTRPPSVAVFHARSTAVGGESASCCQYDSVTVDGHFSLGGWLLVSAELNTWRSCFAHLHPGSNPRFSISSAATNLWNVTSEYVELSPTLSNSTNWVSTLNAVTVGADDFVPIRLGQGANGFTLRDSFLANTGRCHIELTGDHYRTTIDNVTCEQEVQDIIHVGSGRLYNTIIHNVGNAIYTRAGMYCEDGTVVEDLTIDHMRGGNQLSALRFDELRRAEIRNWYTTAGVGGFDANKVYWSDVVVPPSGKRIAVQELYNTWRHRGGDGLLGNQDEMGGALIVRSPNGSRYRLSVADDGTLTTIKV